MVEETTRMEDGRSPSPGCCRHDGADVTATTASIADDHRITPAEGSAHRADGRPADLLNPLDYPVTAVCLACGRPIRVERMMYSEWKHTGMGETRRRTSTDGPCRLP